jgi:hypothetical protein
MYPSLHPPSLLSSLSLSLLSLSLSLCFHPFLVDVSHISDSEMWLFAMQRIQQKRDEIALGSPHPNLENEFEIKKDHFVTFMILRLGPLHAMELLLQVTDFAKSGISHEAYKVYV